MKNINPTVLFFCLSVSLISCSIDEITQDVIFPTNEMNRWIFVDTTFSTHETSVDTSCMGFNYSCQIDGTTVYSPTTLKAQYARCVYRTDQDGNFLECLHRLGSFEYESIHYKIHAQKGDQWGVKLFSYSNQDEPNYLNQDGPNYTIIQTQMTCVCADTLISTPRGTFNCKAFSYSPTQGVDIYVIYLSKNIGPVMVLHYQEGRLFKKRVLMSYTLYHTHPH